MSNRSAIIYIVLLMAFSCIFSLRNGWKNTLAWDAFGYQSYYPILFDGTSGTQDFEEINSRYKNSPSLYQFYETDSVFITKYSSGWAIMYSPFVLTGHLIALNTDAEEDFYSMPYQISVYIGSLVFLCLGWICVWRIVSRLFDKKNAFLSLIITSLGTSYFFYSYNDLTINHHVQFFLVSAFIYLTLLFEESKSKKQLILLGVVLGLIGLVRPTDLVLGIFPVLYFIEFKTFGTLFRKPFLKHTLLTVLIAGGLLSVQLLYWRTNTGEWFYNSYSNNPGEGLDLNDPHFFSFLFSYKSGLFLFFPTFMLLSVGILLLLKIKPSLFLPTALTTFIFFYVVSSWSAYWYAPRAVLDIIPIWAIGAAALFKSIAIDRLKYFMLIALLIFNLFKTWQISQNIIPQLRSTKSSFWKSFFRFEPLSGSDTLLLIPAQDDFTSVGYEQWKSVYHEIHSEEKTYPSGYELNSDQQFIEEIEIDPDLLSHKEDMMVHYQLVTGLEQQSLPKNLMLYMYMKHKGEVYHWRAYHAEQTNLSGTLNWHHYLPIPRSSLDTYHFGVWLNQKTGQVPIQHILLSFRSRK